MCDRERELEELALRMVTYLIDARACVHCNIERYCDDHPQDDCYHVTSLLDEAIELGVMSGDDLECMREALRG